ncbi:DinB family protein [Rhodococcus sp. USK10]|uniref:mycothiol transferase n=1 Tax=Rhodococcus sp. USK10 TaxID=2789739 RepID=UPI001C5D7587|nr:DUF664 domain-containing protein [Rhodococcus sp. USK10]QYB04308.1 DinB family protein [Rhodococcus sp. USK10]
MTDPKADLHDYLQAARDALLWKLDGLSEYDIRRPMTATGTHTDATIRALPLDAPGRIPHWPEDRRDVTLHRILVHVIAETHRHAGHADIVRELVDGTVGLRADNDNLPTADRTWWENYRARLERMARKAGQG